MDLDGDIDLEQTFQVKTLGINPKSPIYISSSPYPTQEIGGTLTSEPDLKAAEDIMCSHCNMSNHHFSHACPSIVRCRKCREAGHTETACLHKLSSLGGETVPCDICQSSTHVEIGCPEVWRSFKYEASTAKTVTSMVICCYNCGGSGHLGGDCLSRKNSSTENNTYSASNLVRYLPSYVPSGFEVVPNRPIFPMRARGQNRSAQVVSDDDNDAANFIRPPTNPKAPRAPPPKMQLARPAAKPQQQRQQQQQRQPQQRHPQQRHPQQKQPQQKQPQQKQGPPKQARMRYPPANQANGPGRNRPASPPLPMRITRSRAGASRQDDTDRYRPSDRPSDTYQYRPGYPPRDYRF
ncbi:MAG: hypothetical protein M1829_005587 [Trizodia sp. TS-e1964]|nr:MAG: hypothetical protein M1829_005587 [Trizodia sp. TS-e1964]